MAISVIFLQTVVGPGQTVTIISKSDSFKIYCMVFYRNWGILPEDK